MILPPKKRGTQRLAKEERQIVSEISKRNNAGVCGKKVSTKEKKVPIISSPRKKRRLFPGKGRPILTREGRRIRF